MNWLWSESKTVNMSEKEFNELLEYTRKTSEKIGFENGYKDGYNLGKSELPYTVKANIHCLLDIIKRICEVSAEEYEEPTSVPYRSGYSVYKSNINIPTSNLIIRTTPMQYMFHHDKVLINDIKDILNGKIDKFTT